MPRKFQPTTLENMLVGTKLNVIKPIYAFNAHSDEIQAGKFKLRALFNHWQNLKNIKHYEPYFCGQAKSVSCIGT